MPSTPVLTSILLPTFNGERYLPSQIESILAQTWSDFELLIVDDGSTDATPGIITEFAGRDDRIRVFPSYENRGQKSRLLELLTQARGQLIAVSDQDDVWDARKLEWLVPALQTSALAYGRSELINEHGKCLNRTLLQANRAIPLSSDRLALLFRPQVSGHAMLARRDVMEPQVFHSAAPYDWLISIVAEFSRGIIYREESMVFHRLHETNLSNREVILRLDPRKLRPMHFANWLRGVQTKRERLVEGLTYLAGTSLIPYELRLIFKNVASYCGQAWIENKPTCSRGELRNKILGDLAPLAGSPHDFQKAEDHVTALTFGLVHPRTMVRLHRIL
jgi:glycosyltransferase involved in cell wall biosynthesis